MKNIKIIFIVLMLGIILTSVAIAQPGSIKNLRNITYEPYHINWTWKDPTDSNFSHVMIYINGTFKTNVTNGIRYYNATNLLPNKSYRISTHTVDIDGNINSTWKNHTVRTARLEIDITPPASVTDLQELYSGETYINWTWQDPNDDDFDKVMIYLNGTFQTNISREYQYFNATGLDPNTSYDIGTHTVDLAGNINSTLVTDTARTSNPRPRIETVEPEQQTIHRIKKESVNFTVSFDQVVNVTWFLNGSIVDTRDMVTSSYYLNDTPSIGAWNITVIGDNINGSVSHPWTWIAHSDSYNAGNRIWDASRDMNTTYMWNSYSFSGFYYDIDKNLSTEELIIRDIDRTIERGDITYTTSPIEVDFEYSGFGKYSVIGFMADKYFAGYTTNSNISSNEEINTIGNGQLHKVLLDDDVKRTISVGSTLTFKEGYVLKAKEIDVGAGPGQIWMVLLKDGNEVDNQVVVAGGTYVYSKRVGSVNDLPIIAISFDKVFRGKEVNAAFITGVFQISDSYTEVKSGNRYGKMEISTVSRNIVIMKNRETADLSSGYIIDLMGDLKIIIADSSTLRFALSVDRQGKFEARGTIYPVTGDWTPLNFGLNVGDKNVGFYYNMDDGIGTENLIIENISDRSIIEDKLIYSTSPVEVDFEYSEFGKYSVIGFMAEKYFAGYTNSSVVSNHREINTIGNGQLHKVFLDDDDKRIISVGSTLTLKESYVLIAKEIDVGAGPGQIWIALLKDGSEVDNGVVEAGDTYIYEKRVGSIDLPIIAVSFDKVFRGREVNAAFIKGVFQISGSYTEVKSGNKYGEMKVSRVGRDKIVMENEDSISLSEGDTIDIMGDIKFKVADDSGTLRFYPFVLVDIPTGLLKIDAPDKAYTGDNITIKVTDENNIGIEDVSIIIDPNIGSIGKTDKDGIILYSIPKDISNRTYTITAYKSEYKEITKNIEILVENRLNINIPSIANQFDTITIYITLNGEPVNGVTLAIDNSSIGVTDTNGKLNYTLNTSGIHVITASKTGYMSVSRDIDVRELFAEFKALDINIVPDQVFVGDTIKVISNVTNIGTKDGMLPVAMKIDNVEVDNISVSITPKETKEIRFMYRVSEKGNYTVEIFGQKKLLEVKEEQTLSSNILSFNILLIAGIITIIVATIIYLLTRRK